MGKSILNVGGFTIIRRIGVGARSTIYLARDEQSKETVALKRVIYEKPEDLRVFEQVENEFKVSQQLDHAYIRKCLKIKRIRSMFKVTELLLSMEHFEADSLEDTDTLSLIDVMLVFRMVATGLHAMHQKGLVHCDIKPNNILMNKNGAVKIIDLGQSCKIGTIKDRIQGTPNYIAPEQVERRPLGPRTDIFNLGATMYWALTGENVPTKIPVRGDNVIGRNVPKECRPPHVKHSRIPKDLSEIVMACVHEDVNERPMNMMELVSALDGMIRGLLQGRKKAGENAAVDNSATG